MQPSVDSWAEWLQTWRCSTPEMAAELAGRVAGVVEKETERLREQLNACCRDRDAKWIELNRLRAENARLRKEFNACCLDRLVCWIKIREQEEARDAE